jgi:hypothetical protein
LRRNANAGSDQQETISNDSTELDVLTAELIYLKNRCCDNSSGNNIPDQLCNPRIFDFETSGNTSTISYFVPFDAKSAKLEVKDSNGIVVESVGANTGYASANFETGNFTNTTYTCSLIIDNNVIGTKQLKVN